MSAPILVIDDDPDVHGLLQLALRPHTLVAAGSGREALEALGREAYAAAVLDLGLPDLTGEQLLERLRRDHPNLPVVVLSAAGDIARVVQCMQLGAMDFVTKPFDSLRLRTSIANAVSQGVLHERIERLAVARRRADGFGSVVGESVPMRAAIGLLRRCAKSDATLLLTGESGTGKEVAARAVHAESRRCAGPFVAVNCGAIAEGVIESELFGHERGAFTGAVATRRGCFEEAHGGTLLLDEIGELRPDLQVRLLRVLQERQVQRVGASQPRAVDVRIIAATNQDLPARVAAGTFRQDLYYRLAVFPVQLPPLRERGDDVLVLARTFLRRAAANHGKPVQEFTAAAAAVLRAHRWPGNVRELENQIERAMILEDGPLLSLGSLTPELQALALPGADDGQPVPRPDADAVASAAAPAAMAPAVPGCPEDVEPFETQEQRIIENALAACGWNIRLAARRLGIGRATIYRKMERFGLVRDDAPPFDEADE